MPVRLAPRSPLITNKTTRSTPYRRSKGSVIRPITSKLDNRSNTRYRGCSRKEPTSNKISHLLSSISIPTWSLVWSCDKTFPSTKVYHSRKGTNLQSCWDTTARSPSWRNRLAAVNPRNLWWYFSNNLAISSKPSKLTCWLTRPIHIEYRRKQDDQGKILKHTFIAQAKQEEIHGLGLSSG